MVVLVFEVEEDDQGLMASKSPLFFEASGRMLLSGEALEESVRSSNPCPSLEAFKINPLSGKEGLEEIV